MDRKGRSRAVVGSVARQGIHRPSVGQAVTLRAKAKERPTAKMAKARRARAKEKEKERAKARAKEKASRRQAVVGSAVDNTIRRIVPRASAV